MSWSSAFTIVFGQDYAPTFKLFNLAKRKAIFTVCDESVFAQ